MTPLATAGCIALVLSVALLCGWGAYVFLWWTEREYFRIVSTFGGPAALFPISALFVGGMIIVTGKSPAFIVLPIVLLLAVLFATWIHQKKYQVPFVEAFVLITSSITLGMVLVFALNSLFSALFYSLPNDWWVDNITWTAYGAPWIGAASGPLITEQLLWSRREAAKYWRTILKGEGGDKLR